MMITFCSKNISCYYDKKEKCSVLNKTLTKLHLGKNGGMVVGHTVKDKITGLCDNKFWMADVGMSSAFGRKSEDFERVEILIIYNDI